MRPARYTPLILELGRRVPQFTASNLTPALSRATARRLCALLCQAGKLVRKRPSVILGWGRRSESVYALKK